MAVTEAEFRDAILPFTLRYEGGLSLDPHDAGNWTGGKVGKGALRGTKYGIAANSHPMLDIRHLSLDEARRIYWIEYCVRPGFDQLPPALCQVAFDAGVNCGPARARAWLAAALKHSDGLAQIRAFSALNLRHHRRLKTWSRYGKGWATRIAACEHQARRLLAVAPYAVPNRQPDPHPDTRRPAPRASLQTAADPITLFFRALFDLLSGRAQPQGA